MAVANDSFSLEDVLIEMGGVAAFIVPSLDSAFDSANEDGFQETGRDSLLDFAGHDHDAGSSGGGGSSYVEYSLGYASSGSAACSDASISPVSVWGDTTSFSNATVLYANSSGTVNASQGYYADTFAGYRYWNGSSFGTGPGSSGSCGF